MKSTVAETSTHCNFRKHIHIDKTQIKQIAAVTVCDPLKSGPYYCLYWLFWTEMMPLYSHMHDDCSKHVGIFPNSESETVSTASMSELLSSGNTSLVFFICLMCFSVMCWGVSSNSTLLHLRHIYKMLHMLSILWCFFFLICLCFVYMHMFMQIDKCVAHTCVTYSGHIASYVLTSYILCVSVSSLNLVASISTAQIQHSNRAVQVCLACRRNSRDVCSVDGQGDKQRDCPWPPNTRLEEDE